MIGGRETWGEPKKIAAIDVARSGSYARATVTRMGVTYLELVGKVLEKRPDLIQHFLDLLAFVAGLNGRRRLLLLASDPARTARDLEVSDLPEPHLPAVDEGDGKLRQAGARPQSCARTRSGWFAAPWARRA